MLSLIFSNMDIQFTKKAFIWRTNIVVKIIPTTRKIKLINKKNFAIAALDVDVETFVVHVNLLRLG